MTNGIKMKRTILFILTVLLIAGCGKNNRGYSELVMSVPETPNTKTHLVPDGVHRLFDVIWDEGDQVKVYDQDGGDGIYTNLNIYEDNNNEVARFGGEGVDISSTVTAFYPVSIASSSNTFVLPYEQTYRGRNNGYMFDYPMWAQQTGGNHIWFRNLTGIVILRVRGHDGIIVRRVYLREPSDPHSVGLRGTYNVSCSGSTHTNEPVVTPVSALYDLTLDCSSNPIELEDGVSKLFYLSVPQGKHSRLLVGLEYQMPGHTEWNTTFEMIFAQTYNETQFIFERSKWTPIDVDVTGLDGSLIYDLKNIVLNPNQEGDTVVNTGIPLTTEFGEYTFAFDITPDDISSLDHNNYMRKTIYSEMDNLSSNWNGVLIRLAKQNNSIRLEVQIGNSTTIYTTQAITSGTRHQFVVTISNYSNTQGTATIYFKRNNSVTTVNSRFTKTKWVTTTNPVPEIGGDQHISGRYFDGTIHSFSIYNRVWTTQEINNFIHQ